jgi:outer membrane protein
MKKLILIHAISMMFICFKTYAQPEVGKLLIGGSSSFNFQSSKQKYKMDQNSVDADRTTTIQFLPQVGYMITDNLAGGLELGYTSTSISDSDEKVSAIAIGPFIKYYIDVNSPTVYPFLYGAVAIGSQKISDDEDEFKSNITAYGLGGGLAVFLGEKISLDIGLSYLSKNTLMKEFNNLKIIDNNIILGVGFTLFL